MKTPYIFTSLTRISDLDRKEFIAKPLAKEHWETGDYIICKILNAGGNSLQLELSNGRMRGVMGGEMLVGALGERFATLEATGTWKEVKDDLKMHVLTGAGLLGKMTSKSVFIPQMMKVGYLGHATRNGKKLTMDDFVKPIPQTPLKTPVVLFVGTSMSAGKTTSARIVTNLFKSAGLKLVGAKLTGAGRYKDILALKDVGADDVLDFVDVGLPSSICDGDRYKTKLQGLLSRIASCKADVAVIEIGASPLEPYNGDIAINMIREQIRCVILSASDPYAVYGLMKAFEIVPDIVTGISTNTLAGRAMVEKLCNVRALNLIDPNTSDELRNVLSQCTGFEV